MAKNDTGDGLSTITAAPAGAGPGVSTDVELGSRVSAMIQKHGTAKTLPVAKHTVNMAKIYAVFGAKTAEQKNAVEEVITFLAITHGCGPNVAWEVIPAYPEGCREVMMNEVVDKIVTRAYHRRFMTRFSARAVKMFESSPELQLTLSERAVRNGLAVTDSLCVIDFLDQSSGVNAHALSLRAKSKYSAVSRANMQGISSVEKSADKASNAMHSQMHDSDADSLAG